MEALLGWVFMSILGVVQAGQIAYSWYSRRERTKAEATQITANSFDTMVGTVTNLTTKLSDTLMKSIEGINSREEKIDKLGEEIRQLTSDNKELRERLNEAISASANRDNRADLQQQSINEMAGVNKKLSEELIEVKAQVYTIEKELKIKNAELQKRDQAIKEKDEKILQLETRVKHLEQEVELLKKPVAVVVEEKLVEPKTET